MKPPDLLGYPTHDQNLKSAWLQHLMQTHCTYLRCSMKLCLLPGNAHLEDLSISNNFPEDLSNIHIKQAAASPLEGDGLTPLADVGPHHPEGLGLEGSNLLVPLHTEIEGGGLTGPI